MAITESTIGPSDGHQVGRMEAAQRQDHRHQSNDHRLIYKIGNKEGRKEV